MKIKCPQCDASLRISSPNLLGKQVNCPRCGVVVAVPKDAKLDFDEVKTYKKVRCNGCLSKLRVKPELIGKSIQCPMCNKRLRTPAPSAKTDSHPTRAKPEFVAAMALDSESDHSGNSDFVDAVEISDLPPPLAEEVNSGTDQSTVEATPTVRQPHENPAEEIPEANASFLRPANSEPKIPGQVHQKASKQRNWFLVPLMIAVAALISIVILGTLAYLFFSRGGNLEAPNSKTQSSSYQIDQTIDGTRLVSAIQIYRTPSQSI